MSVELYRESPGKFESRTLNMETLNRWTGRTGSSAEQHRDKHSRSFMVSLRTEFG